MFQPVYAAHQQEALRQYGVFLQCYTQYFVTYVGMPRFEVIRLSNYRAAVPYEIAVHLKTVAILWGGWVSHVPPQCFRNFLFKFVWLTYTVDNFRPAIFQTII